MRAPLRLGLIGHDISYSMSPAIFREIFRLAGITGEFELISVAKEELSTAITTLKERGFTGVSVTIPHKQGDMAYIDSLDSSAEVPTAVNCVHFTHRGAIGFNTDGRGFADSLRHAASGQEFHDILVLGSGGAGRGVISALLRDLGVKRCFVATRTAKGPNQLLKRIEEIAGIAIVTVSAEEALRDRVYDLVVNCTPLGGWHAPNTFPYDRSLNRPFARLYYDLNYNMPNAAILRAREIGQRACDGSMMLVAQAVAAFAVFKGTHVDAGEVYEGVFGMERAERGW